MCVIGKIDWAGCAGCVFSDQKEGGCTVDEQELMDNLTVAFDMGTVTCGCFHAFENTEPQKGA